MPSIHFFSQEIDFVLSKKTILRSWIIRVVANENRSISELNFIFCTDQYLVKLNRDYLSRDYFTDVITFDQSEADKLQGEVYISIPQVKENAGKYQNTFSNELSRVMIHGVLHLLGYRDGSDKEKQLMRKKEEASLSLLPS